MTPEEIVDFFMTVCKCQRMLEEYYKTTSSTVTVQDGEFAGQTVRVSNLGNFQLLSEISGYFSQIQIIHFLVILARSLPRNAPKGR